ncbi:hypothetical protein [Desulfuromonas acetoxidans]|uniref:hypothetical protein n=1 Tax=Desulfuromonas acetoxidans TaxID=891 RepID=UPI00292D9B23|nr:hypothetical protein [Desulfuromonas acetoxidans]
METLPHIPSQIYAGDTLSFTRSLADYSAADGWALSYTMNGPAKVTFTTTADGSIHVALVAAATTAGWGAGTYTIVEAAVKGDERYTVGISTIEVLANPADGVSTDQRPHCKRMLDAIEATLEGTATTDQRRTRIDGDELERMDIIDLIKVRDIYAAKWAALQRKQSGKTSRLIKARF